MSRQQCCDIINRLGFICGRLDYKYEESINELLNSKNNNDIQTRAGYYSDFLLRNHKTILVNFGADEAIPVQIPLGFNAVNYNIVRDVVKRLSELGYNRRHRCRDNLGAVDPVFENIYSEKNVIEKIIACFDKVLAYTGLRMLVVNTGDYIDIRMTDEEINRNEVDKYDIELVLNISLLSRDSPILREIDGSGAVSHIGKTAGFNIEIIPYVKTPIKQHIYMNKYTNQIMYHEKSMIGVPLLEYFLIFNFPTTDFDPTPENITRFKENINQQLVNVYNDLANVELMKRLYYVLTFNLVVDDALPNNPKYLCTFIRTDNLMRDERLSILPQTCEIIVNEGQRNSFGIEPGYPLIFPEGSDTIHAEMHTLFFNKLWLGDSYSSTIIHEFCHVLGMIHEFSRNIPDNPYNQIGIWAEGKERSLIHNANGGSPLFDRNSIMMYVFDSCNFSFLYDQDCDVINTRFNQILSSQDKLTLSQMYPVFKTVEKYTYNNSNNNSNSNSYFLYIILGFFILILIYIVITLFIYYP